jgi:hypothetical protein
MKFNESLVKDLENLINENLKNVSLPYVKGNSIRIRHMIIRESKKGFLVYDSYQNRQIARTYSKIAAVALAKTCAEGYEYSHTILELDKIIEKNFVDSIFYKNTINKTNNDLRRYAAEDRYDIARERVDAARKELDKFIFRYAK